MPPPRIVNPDWIPPVPDWIPTDDKVYFSKELKGEILEPGIGTFGSLPENMEELAPKILRMMEEEYGGIKCLFPCCTKKDQNIVQVLCVKTGGHNTLLLRMEPDGNICGYPNRNYFPICEDCMKYSSKTQDDILFWFMGYDPSKEGYPVLASIETEPPYLCNIPECTCEGFSPSYFRNEYNYFCENAMRDVFFSHFRSLPSTIAGSYADSRSADTSDSEDIMD